MSTGPRGRFKVAGGALCAERPTIDPVEAHHMRVLRLGVGDHVVLFDGRGEEATAQLEMVTEDHVTARVLERHTPATESALDVWLIQAVPTKLTRMDLIVRQCTELGMTRLLPIIAARSQVPSGGVGVIEERRARWQRLADAAAKQSRRTVVPHIGVPMRLQDLDWSSIPELRLVCDPRGGSGALAQTLRNAPATRVALMVGPEGGWNARERALAQGSDATTVAFGPRVLRADTAGAAALAVLQHVWGDLG
ncbi:MAG TPA: 16S rRNA (uracil(1498)-N(3))-methyltransferase [Acidobacteriota bacterium]|nr:16S rRNA (uracil(1498)-N(3))-methyltransferase [Acidobacteriota bacterium]